MSQCCVSYSPFPLSARAQIRTAWYALTCLNKAWLPQPSVPYLLGGVWISIIKNSLHGTSKLNMLTITAATYCSSFLKLRRWEVAAQKSELHFQSLYHVIIKYKDLPHVCVSDPFCESTHTKSYKLHFENSSACLNTFHVSGRQVCALSKFT